MRFLLRASVVLQAVPVKTADLLTRSCFVTAGACMVIE
jgi:hypothetical protein